MSVQPGSERVVHATSVATAVTAGSPGGNDSISRLGRRDGSALELTRKSWLLRSRQAPSLRSTLGLIMLAFVLAGVVQVFGGALAARYTNAVVFVSQSVARWLEPVPLGRPARQISVSHQEAWSLFLVKIMLIFSNEASCAFLKGLICRAMELTVVL